MRERQNSTIPNFIDFRSVDLEFGPSNTNLGREIILWKERLSPWKDHAPRVSICLSINVPWRGVPQPKIQILDNLESRWTERTAEPSLRNTKQIAELLI